MPTTTNYGWTTPADTDLVKDGALAIRTLGNSIDSTLKTQIDAQIPDSLVTTKGDIIAATAASTPSRLAVGTNNQVLMADSAAATGLKYANEATATLTAKGDVLTATAANTLSRLAVGTNNQVLTADSTTATGLKWATPSSPSLSGVSLYKSGNQSLTSGVSANATFDTELFDTDAFHSTSSNTDRITVPSGKAGYYLLTGRANFAASATGIRIGMIRKNAGATQLARHTMNNQTTAADAVLTVNTVVNLSVGDYVVFECYQDGTGALNLQGGGEQYTSFSAIYLGA